MNSSKVNLVFAALKGGPATSKEISLKVDITVANINKHLKRLKFERKVHIQSWIRMPSSPKFSAVWALGYDDDAKKPEITEDMKKKSRNERQRIWRARECVIGADRASLPDVSTIKPQNPFSALFG